MWEYTGMCLIVHEKKPLTVSFTLNHDFDNDPGRKMCPNDPCETTRSRITSPKLPYFLHLDQN